MKRGILAVSFAILLCVSGPLMSEEELTARQIMDKSDEQLRSDDARMEANFTMVSKRGKVTKRRFESFSKQVSPTEERRFLKFLEPADIRGTILLTYDYDDKDDDIWLFLPALGRPRRISSGNKTDSFVGSDLTFEDLENVDLENTEFTLLRSEALNGVHCFVIEGKPANEREAKESGYSKKIFWIDKELFLPRQLQLYDKKKGELLKVLKLDDLRQIEGSDKHRLLKSEMENVVKGRKTFLEYTDVLLDAGVPDKTFSQRMLK